MLPDHDEEGEGYLSRIIALMAKLDPKPMVKVVRLPLTGEGDDVVEWLDEVVPKEWTIDVRRAELERLADSAEAIDLDSVSAVEPMHNDRERSRAKRRERPTAQGQGNSDAGLYFEQDGRLWTGGDEAPEPLTVFTARIVANVTRHEAGKASIRYHVRAQHQDPAIGTREIAVEHDKYSSLSWVYAMGAEYVIRAGRDAKDHVRCAVQMFSKEDGIRSVVEHTTLGWIKDGDRWLYLHGGGAIGVDGPSDAVRVDLPPTLTRYRLAEPPRDPAAVRTAIEATLETWRLAKAGTPGARSTTAIVATLPWRAVLSPFNASPHLGGPSGNLKTLTARLVLQYFSTEFRGRSAPTPAGWGDTKNALQRLAYDCGCSVLVIDDLKTQEQLEVAEQVFQAQGNLQARSRMGMDQSLQPQLDPRGTVLSTGEVDCRTASALGRMLVVEIKAGDIDKGVLSRLQRAGDAGLSATAMAACIRWLAPRLDEVRARFATLTAEIRADLGEIPGAHPRHPDAIAELIAAYRLYLEFAVEVGAIASITAESYAAKAREYLVELAEAQAGPQTEAKPGRKFLDLIAAALRSKRCHLADANSDNAPSVYPVACGWHKDWLYQGKDEGQTLDWKIPANSKLLGFIDEAAGWVYLDDTEAVAVANEQGRRHYTPQTFSNIGRELLNEGLCRAHADGTKKRATADKRIRNHGKNRYFWIAIKDLFGPPVDPVDDDAGAIGGTNP